MSIATSEKPPIEQPAPQLAEKKPEVAEKLVIFAWSGELDKMWPTLILAHLAKEHHVASPHELLEVAKEMGVHLIPCQMTMDLLGLKREDLIDGLDEPAGATMALAQAQGAITLFI